MLTELEAKKIGIRACMEKIGFDFCIANEENSSTTYGVDNNGKMFCFVGIDNIPDDDNDSEVLILSSVKGFPYHSSCNVDMSDGEIEFLDFASYSN